MSPPVRLGQSFLFAGYAKLNDRGTLEPPPRSLSPVRDLVLFTSDPSVEAKADALTAWMTDSKGLLFPLSGAGTQRPTAVHYFGTKRRFHVPPPGVLLQAWAANRDNWAQTLAGLLEKKAGHPGVVLNELPIRKDQLRPPDRADESAEERAWAAFYDKLSEGSNLSAFVLAQTRALMLRFTSAQPQDTVVTLLPPENKPALTLTLDPKSGFQTGIVLGTPDTLPAGLYTFRIHREGADRKTWSSTVVKGRHYELKEMVRFGISNFAGEFDVVCCDPISVEEAVMLQFPALYAHRTAAAKKRTDYPEIEVSTEFKDFPKALEQWAERVSWATGRAKLTVGLINADGNDKRAKDLGKVVWGAIKPTDDLLASMKNSIDLGFSVADAAGGWDDLKKEFAAQKELAGLKKLLWKDLDGPLERNRWWKYVKREHVDGDAAKIFSLANATDAERAGILKAGIPQKRTRLQEMLGDGAGGAVDTGLLAAKHALEVYKAALAVNDALEARKQLADLESDFASLVQQVDGALARGASREGIGNLERLRIATIAADLEMDEKEAAALLAAVDVVLGLLSLTGVGGAALAAVVLAKDVAGLGKDVALEGAAWLDRLLNRSIFADTYSRQFEQLAKLARVSSSNQSLMPDIGDDGGADDLHVQFRLRAEALHGLVGLLTRASVAAENETDYLERVREYEVAEYIEHYLLGDGWQFPVRPIIPIGMDAAWLYLRGTFGATKTGLAVAEQFGFAKPLTAGTMSIFPGAMTMLTVVDTVMAGSAVANYQRTFPVHRRESAVDDLARAFRTAWQELDHDAVAHTQVYWRPRGSTEATAWTPLDRKGATSVEELRILSPLDQIRILVVLKATVRAGTYPVSFQLVRTDGANVSGPLYREITRRLGKEDLLPDEQAFAGRLGCVFHPFYQVGQQVVPGIKPLAPAAKSLGVGFYQLLGYLDDMRYAFKLRLGDSAHSGWVKLNGYSDEGLDELRVGFSGLPDEGRLLVADFLARESEQFEYPRLFGSYSGFGPVYVRVGGGPYRLATPEEDATVTFADFDWKQPVEFVVVGWAFALANEEWDRQQLDWSRVPVELELASLETLEFADRGPGYASTLNHLGTLHTQDPALLEGRKAPDASLTDWLRQVRGSRAELQKLVDAVHPRSFASTVAKQDRYSLFAASFTLDYVTPGGARVKSLRPFGEVHAGDERYRIAIRNVRAAKGCGLEQENLLAPVASTGSDKTRYTSPEYEFHFAAPKAGDAGLPWAGVDPARVEKWIEDEGAKRNPNVQLVAPAP